ncbi:MAG: hypothetical protein BWX88_02783 [Planctomycetes bacterium ADurb.Bin126]|nr:MAG: hypothetical protein BWX88_02783 [Planctomycetes bacterium ADurb.Bin126]HOD79932.1 hypothetical protein [Phycisphaerae bacterium]HQL73253.1 hypothetical protein [Phycisphaerae bacterium]
MSCGADWFRSYLAGRLGTDWLVAHRRERVSEARDRDDEAVVDDLSREALVRQIDELRLVVAAMLRVLLDSGTVVPAALEKAAEEIDLLDGVADGRLRGQVEADGHVTAQPRQHTPLDDLAEAVEGGREEGGEDVEIIDK